MRSGCISIHSPRLIGDDARVVRSLSARIVALGRYRAVSSSCRSPSKGGCACPHPPLHPSRTPRQWRFSSHPWSENFPAVLAGCRPANNSAIPGLKQFGYSPSSGSVPRRHRRGPGQARASCALRDWVFDQGAARSHVDALLSRSTPFPPFTGRVRWGKAVQRQRCKNPQICELEKHRTPFRCSSLIDTPSKKRAGSARLDRGPSEAASVGRKSPQGRRDGSRRFRCRHTDVPSAKLGRSARTDWAGMPRRRLCGVSCRGAGEGWTSTFPLLGGRQADETLCSARTLGLRKR